MLDTLSSVRLAAVSAPQQPLIQLLREAVQRHASDLHVGDGDPPMLRIAGELRALDGARPSHPVATLVASVLTAEGQRRLAEGRAVDFAFSAEGLGRFRGNVYRALRGDALAVRVLPERIPTLTDLRLPTQLSDLVGFKDGLVLVSGPTGSGKSATLAALVDHVNEHRADHILTLEEPVEFVHGNRRSVVRQREVGVHVGSFAEGLRDALREDPDVILVGEMRDVETVSLALTAAETGHLVLSTLHANRAASAIDRILDVFPPHRHDQMRGQLADTLRAVVAQRLLPTADGHGRVPTVEVLRVNHAAANHIRENRLNQIPSVMQTHREEGMWVLERHLAGLVKKGHITQAVGARTARDQQLFETYLRT